MKHQSASGRTIDTSEVGLDERGHLPVEHGGGRSIDLRSRG